MRSVQIRYCNSCGAPIRWAETLSGAKMPVDAEPHPEGNLIACPSVGPNVVAVYKREELRLLAQAHPNAERWRSHFASCPDAAKHRKEKSSHG